MASRKRPEYIPLPHLEPFVDVPLPDGWFKGSIVGGLVFKYLVYNPKTDEVGIPFLFNGFWLVDVGMLGSKPFTDTWCVVGKL